MTFRLPDFETTSQGEEWWIKVRTAPLSQERVPLESTLSYPIPGPGVLFFFHTLPASDSDGCRIYTRITAKLPEAQIVEFHTAREGDLFPGLAQHVAGKTQPYDTATEAALFQSYPAVVQRYSGGGPSGALGEQFLEALERLVPADLLPYYEALNPDFFAWCRAR